MQCRRAAATQAACEIRWKQRRVEGKRNLADYVGRAADRGQLRPGDRLRGPGAAAGSPNPRGEAPAAE
eukprot:6925393-Lingulodinium_polyedra.AAC.1